MIRAITTSAYYQYVIFLRLKPAMFFTVVFPVFLFIVFGFIWGTPGDTTYFTFLLTGIAGTTALSDGLFAVGPVVKDYYSSGFIRYVRQMPMPTAHVAGLFLSRYVVLSGVVLLLTLTGGLLFGLQPSVWEVVRLLGATALGFTCFSVLGLAVSFLGDKVEKEKGVANILYFLAIFTSPAFYPIDLINPAVASFGEWLPLTPVLQLARGEAMNWPCLLIWTAIALPLFLYGLKRKQITR